MLDIIKNPVIIGLTIGILVYLYLKWDASTKKRDEKNKRKDSNLLIPLFLGIASWFIANNYFEKYNFDETPTNNINLFIENTNNELPYKLNLTDPVMTGGANLVNNVGNKFSNIQPHSSYHLLKKGVSIPNNISMPDVLLENF